MQNRGELQAEESRSYQTSTRSRTGGLSQVQFLSLFEEKESQAFLRPDTAGRRFVERSAVAALELSMVIRRPF
jgi:hypothetical protein